MLIVKTTVNPSF